MPACVVPALRVDLQASLLSHHGSPKAGVLPGTTWRVHTAIIARERRLATDLETLAPYKAQNMALLSIKSLTPMLVGTFVFGGAAFWILGLQMGFLPALKAVELAVMHFAGFALVLVAASGAAYLRWPSILRPYVTALAASLLRTFGGLAMLYQAGLAISFLQGGLAVSMFAWVPSSTTTDPRAVALGASGGALYCVIFFSELSSSLGFPSSLRVYPHKDSMGYLRIQGRILGLFAACAAYSKPEWLFVFVFLFAGLYCYFAFDLTLKIAKTAFNRSPEVEGATPARLDSDIAYAIHVTDVHVVGDGERQIEGGPGGGKRAAELVNAIAIHPPKFFLITGDLTERGGEDEYREVLSILEPLEMGGRTHILFAPGNHDLGAAYTATNHFITLASLRYAGPRWVWRPDGLRLLSYLDAAVRLHSTLVDSLGHPLRQTLDRYRKRDAYFERTLADIRGTTNFSPLDARAISKLNAIGDKCYPNGVPGYGWAVFVRAKSAFRQNYLRSWYGDRWYDLFPLYANFPHESALVVILNSVSPDLTIGGSAWGELSHGQIKRLQEKLNRCKARKIIILVHHSPFKWKDEPLPRFIWRDVQRWGFLPFDLKDGLEFVSVLRQAVSNRREVIVFCGHRHGFDLSKGQSKEAPVGRCGTYEGITVVEGAALAETGTAALAAVIGGGGRLELRALPAYS